MMCLFSFLGDVKALIKAVRSCPALGQSSDERLFTLPRPRMWQITVSPVM
jgi:hypothetical protein